MPHVQPSSTADADLFALIHRLLDEDRLESPRERRGGKRLAFVYDQLIAPYVGERLPNQSEFQLVQCHDLSPSGFSFRSNVEPAYDRLIVALGNVPFTFLSARVVGVTPIAERHRTQFRVGCIFDGRIEA
jgi:hypothetical protein